MHRETITVGQFQVNCYLLWNDRNQALVIDPGDEADRIADAITRNGLSVAAYMLTHGHMDHISALAALHRRHPAPVGLHADDLSWAFTAGNQMPPWYGMPERPAAIERVFADGQAYDDHGLACRIIATPGHTPGGVCLYFEQQKTLISGDTLFAGSVGRTDLPGGDSRVLTASLKRLAALPDDVVVYPGHGPATTIGHERATNFFMQFRT